MSEQEGELSRAQSWGELQHTLETEIAALRAQQHADTAKQDDMKALIQELTIQVDALSERNHLLHEKAEQAEALTLAFRDRPPASLRKSGFGVEEFERCVCVPSAASICHRVRILCLSWPSRCQTLSIRTGLLLLSPCQCRDTATPHDTLTSGPHAVHTLAQKRFALRV